MDWADNELLGLDLSDKRLNKRAKKLMVTLGDTPEKSIPGSCKSWAETKAAYRFFNHRAVTAKKMIKPHIKATLERIGYEERVLLIEDTTILNFSGQAQRKDIGPIQQANVRGIFLHPMLAVTPHKKCLGILSYQQWCRDDTMDKTPSRERKLQRQTTPIQKKESFRWLQGYKKASRLAKAMPGTKFTYLADREGDIYDIYHQAQKTASCADWVIRATFLNRNVRIDPARNKHAKLKEHVISSPVLGEITFHLPKSHKRKQKLITQTIYTKRVTLSPPREKRGTLSPVEITVLVAKEKAPPKGAEPIDWVLLSNLKLSTLEDASKVIQWYLCRWQIEVFFKILKRGCNIEKCQLNDQHTFDPCLAMYLIVAWRILYLTMLGRCVPSLSCEAVFEPIEWQTAYLILRKKPPPKDPPTLKEALLLIAQLGGFLGRKGDGEPGPKAMWEGLQHLSRYIEAREAIETVYGKTYG